MMGELVIPELFVTTYARPYAHGERPLYNAFYRAAAWAYLHWAANQHLDDDGCPLHVVQR